MNIEQIEVLKRYNSLPAETRKKIDEYYKNDHPYFEPKWRAVLAWEERNEADIMRSQNEPGSITTATRAGNRDCDECGGTCWIQVHTDKGVIVHRCGCHSRQVR